MLLSSVNAVAHRPMAMATTQARFGSHAKRADVDNSTVKPPVAPKPAKSGGRATLAHWILTGLLGVGVGGGVVQNQHMQNQLARERETVSSRLAELNSRVSLDQLVKVVNQVTPSTVRVEGSQGLGSGVIIQDNRGRLFVLTNSHVTEDNDINGTYRIKLYNGSDYSNPVEFSATPVRLSNGDLAASNSEIHDLALLQIPPDIQLPPSVRPVVMRDINADPLRVGETVVAVGNPYGNRDSVSSGIISHVDRGFRLEPQNRFIQTDAPINPGNSGGGLFDMQGRLIGINTLGYRGADGLGGAIRIDVVKAVIERWGVPVHNQDEKILDLKPLEQPANPFKGLRPPPQRKAEISTPKSQTNRDAAKP